MSISESKFIISNSEINTLLQYKDREMIIKRLVESHKKANNALDFVTSLCLLIERNENIKELNSNLLKIVKEFFDRNHNGTW